MLTGVEAGARDHVEDAAEAIAKLCGKAARDDVDRLNHVGRETGREQLVRVVVERHAVDERVQGQLVAAQVHEVVMACDRA